MTRSYIPRAGMPDNPNDPRHGTENGYTNCACRCDRCTIVHREASRLRGGQKPFHPAEHGTRSKYVRGCRCDDCRRAERDYKREVRAAAARKSLGLSA